MTLQKSPPPSLPYPVHPNSFNFGWLAEKPPSLPPSLPPSPTQFIQIHSTLGLAGRKAPLPASPTQFIQIHSTLVWLAEKPLLPPSLPYPVHPNSFNFGLAGRKAPPTQFIQIHSTLVQLAEKSDSSYPNIFYRLPTFSTFQNTHIYRTTGLRIMVHMECL